MINTVKTILMTIIVMTLALDTAFTLDAIVNHKPSCGYAYEALLLLIIALAATFTYIVLDDA